MTTYFELPDDIRELREGDLVDLQGHDQSPANALSWEYELAEVESVSTHDRLAGGWLDGMVTEETAIVYVTNAPLPARVPDRRATR